MRQVCCSLGKRDHWMNLDDHHRLLAPKRKEEKNQTNMRYFQVEAY